MGMLDSLSTSTAGMSAQAAALGNISGNIANSSTTGYKRVETSFADLIPDGAGSGTVSGSVGDSGRQTTTVAGQIKSSDVPTNMALSGSGFFVVAQNTGSGTSPSFASSNLYTRRGDFAPDQNGYLVNGAGYYLVGSSGGSAASPIKIPTAPLASGATLSSVSVGTDGKLTGSYSDGSTAALGTVAVANFASTDNLSALDGGAYAATGTSGSAVIGLGNASVQGGSTEASNTDISDQFSKMIMTQQAYSSNSKVMSIVNDMLQDTINLVT